ncbi:hypothetical protein DVG80_32470 [Rhodococcus erythropolis]|nr:hypothetical protein DVG80_32470 [Rhodococcus erythropolis]
MVVTGKPGLAARLLLLFLAAFATMTLLAPPASAQEDDPSVLGTALDAANCFSVAGATNAVTDFFGVTENANSCGEAVGAVATGAQSVVKSVATGAFESVGLDFGEAGVAILKFALGWWIAIPNLDENTFLSTLGAITQYTYWIQVAFLTTSLMFLGIRLAMARSGAIRDTSTEGFQQLARATVLAGSLGFIVVLGTRLSDNISRWFIEGTVGSDPDALVDAMIQVAVYGTPGGTALLFVVGLIGILGGLVMAFLLLMRMGLLVVICAALPIAGAAGGTKIGSQAYEKMIAWTLAFLLFKPVGSFVIGVSAMLFMQSAPSRDENGGALTAIVGALLLCSAALVLPALMRLLATAVGAVGGGGSGMAAAAGAAAVGMKVGGMVATGGASAGAGAAGGGAGAAGAAGGEGATSGAMTTSAPPSFGSGSGGGGDDKASGGGIEGSIDGTPASASGTPQGGDDTAPGASGASGGSGDSEAFAGSATGAPEPSNGGFQG